MKIFRWSAAGVMVVLLTALVFWQTSLSKTRSSRSAGLSERGVAPVPASVPADAPSVKAASAAPSVVSQKTVPAMDGFETWAREYAKADPIRQQGMLDQGEAFAKERRAEMTQLIRHDPEQAIARALPYSLRKQLPERILDLIEHPVSGRGEFRPIYYKPLPGHENEVPPTGYEVVMNKKRYETHTYGERIFQPAHDSAFLHGVGLSLPAEADLKNKVAAAEEEADGQRKATGIDLLALSADATRTVTDADELADLTKQGKLRTDAVCGVSQKPANQNGRQTVLQFGDNYYSFCQPAHAQQFNDRLNRAHGVLWASGGGSGTVGPNIENIPVFSRPADQGIFKLLYIRVTFADDPISPQSEDGAHATAQNNNRYYNEGSYGTVWWETTVTPVIRLPQRKNFYGESPGDLLFDAVSGAAALGYFSSDYFMYYVLCNSLTQYKFGGLSSGILNGSPGAISHELGHNFGLPHANYWQPEGRQPPPMQPTNAPPYPIDPDSLIGHYDINAPYNNRVVNDEPVEQYGNPHDVMGSGPGHFSAMFKNYMNWLPDNFIKTASASTTNRIYAFDTPHITEGRLYAMRIRKDYFREFWISYRQGFSNNPWFSTGVEVDWNSGVNNPGFGLRIGNNLLLDTTPDSTFAKQDAALVIGRTLKDSTSDIYITPIAGGGGPAPEDKWIDVVLQKGPFPANQVPSVFVSASSLIVSNGATVSFTATAEDADGDQLAYYWDFGDYTFGSNGPNQSKTFNVDGQYVVRCEVSDMKGGFASAQVVVTVGTPTTFTISGRVLDIFGNPVQGVRVHNSGVKPASPPPAPDGITTNSAITNIGTYRYGFTDSQGYYVIGNIPPGTYTNRAFLFGYRIEPLDFTDPIQLNNGNANDLNFTATPLTRVKISHCTDAFEEGGDGTFTIAREGDISQDLYVRFQLSGTAIINTDYTIAPADTSVTNRTYTTNGDVITTNITIIASTNRGQLIIPAGMSSMDLYVTPIDNTLGDGDKSVVLTLLLQTNEFRISTVLTNVLITNGTIVTTNTMLITVTNEFRIPGWELRPSGPNSQLTWFQTDPTYVLDTAEARIEIQDDDPPEIPSVGVIALDYDAVETRGDNATLVFYRQGAPLDSDLVVNYSVDGNAYGAFDGVDYLHLPGKVTIPAGRDYALVYLTAVNDLFVEGFEYVFVSVEPGPDYTVAPFDDSTFLEIVDDDLPLVNIFAADSTAVRGGGGARVTISRAGSLDEDLLVNYFVTGTAVSGVDFNTLAGSVVIPAGQLSVDVTVSAINTSTNRLPRTVTILLADAPTYNIFNQNSATITLVDGVLPTVTLATSADTVSESGGTASFIVTRTGSTSNSLSVFFDVGGSAWEGIDYGSIGTNIVIPAGSNTVSITIDPINDSARELGDVVGEETVIVQLRANTNYILGGTSGRTMRIVDDDSNNNPAVGFMLSGSSVREDEGIAYLYVKVSANPFTNKPIQVEYRVTGGSAVANVNYINLFPESATFYSSTGILNITHYTPPDPPPQFFDFEDGIYVVPVQILDDGAASGNKTLTISLFNPSRFETNMSRVTNANGMVFTNILITRIPTNAFLGPSVTHTLTIVDVGVTAVSIAASTNFIFENGPASSFIVTREGPTNNALTVSFAVAGDAAQGNDYVLSTGTNLTVSIPAGTNSAVITVSPIDDPAEEAVETIILRLLARPGYVLSSAEDGMYLFSDDGTVQFGASEYAVEENIGMAFIVVYRTGNTNLPVAVDVRFMSGSAINGVDFLGSDGRLTIPAGATVGYIPVEIIDDALVETNETFSVLLTNATGGVQLGGQKTITFTIISDDTAFDFALPSFRAPENGGSAPIVISRRGWTNNGDTVVFSATNGTAGAADFVATNIVVTFLPGESNQTVYVALLDDDLFEGDETVAVSLSNPSFGTQLGPTNTATLSIVDDECTLDFQTTGFSGAEYSNFVSVVVRRLGGTVNPVSVNYSTADVTATNGFDYSGGSGTIYFAGDHYELDTNGTGNLIFVPGDAVRVLNIPLIDDTLGEGNETFTVTLNTPVGPSPGSFPASTLLGSNVTATVTILDNELPGNVDYEFSSGANAPVHSVAIAPRGGLVEFAGRVVLGGEFTQVDALALNHVARLLPSGSLDTSFNPGAGANSNVFAVAVQADGKVLVGGDFTRMDNTNRIRLARLNADGHLDLGFDSGSNGVNGIVRAIAVQTNGQIIIAGDFTQVNGVTRSHIARLGTDGTLDTNFTAAANGNVNALAIQADGKIIIGGDFTQVNGNSRPSLARLNSNGSLDTSLAIGSGFAGAVNAVAVQTDGAIVAGGAFTGFNGANARFLARLSSAGAFDVLFNPGGIGPDGIVNSVGISSNGKIVIGGAFTNYNGLSRNRFTRLNSNGSLDGFFFSGTGANAEVRSLVVQPDSAIVIGGDFTEVNGLPRNYIARIHGDERFDVLGVEFSASTYYVPEPGVKATITVQRAGNTNRAFNVEFKTFDGTATDPGDYAITNGTLSFAAGELTKTFDVRVFDDALVEGNETVNLILTNASAGVDLTGVSSAVLVIIDSAQTVSFAMTEFTVGEGDTNAIITMVRGGDLSGSVTATFSTRDFTAAAGYDYTGVTNTVTFTNGQGTAVALVPISNDDQAEFTETVLLQLSPPASAFIVNPSSASLNIVDNDLGPGFPDTAFDPVAGASRFVRALALQPDGRLLVGGAFTNFANSNLNFLARLHTNGAVDTNFTPGTGPNALVAGIGLSADGHIAIAGAFTNYNGAPFNRVVRLTTNGLPDPSFSQPVTFDAAANALASQNDGKILVGGGFRTPVSGFARIRINGTLDLQFDSGGGSDAPVHAMALQSDGKTLIGGAFTNVGGFISPRVARLGTNGVVDATFAPVNIPTGIVFAVATAPGGKVLIGGSFRSVNGFARSGVARLNSDGSLDLTFNPGTGVTGIVYTVSSLTNGAVFIGGDFTTFNGVQRTRYALLRENGSVDSSFDSTIGADNTVYASVITPDQRVIIGGDFTTVGGVVRRGVARLNPGDATIIRVTGPQIVLNAARVSINTTAGTAYVLEGSSDVLYWFALSTNIATGATLDFTDPNVSANGQRFYRARRFGP